MAATSRRPCTTCGRNRSERFFRSARARVCADCIRAGARARSRRNHVAATYGLSAEQHARLLAHQGGVCAICGGTRRYALNVDHDHATGAVRGLCCRRCNKLLAMVGDDPALLAAAWTYLAEPPMVAMEREGAA